MRNAITTVLLAALAISCVLAGSINSRADETDDNLPKRSKLGRNWKKVSDALDEAYEAMQEDADIEPAPLADDHVWLRRVYLDLTGEQPSPAEIKALNPRDGNPDTRAAQSRREAIVEYLLKTTEFRDHMATWWSTILLGRGSTVGVRNIGASQVYAYMYNAFEQNLPWDGVVRGLFAGTPGISGSPNYGYLQTLIQSNDLAYVAGSASRVFLGRQIQCAQCHDSKTDDWTQDDFEAWQAFFKSFTRETRVEDQTILTMTGDLAFGGARDLENKLKLEGEYKLPRFLDGREWSPRDGKNLRVAMADWLTSKDNPWFAEMTVNRFMGYFLGVAFVNPVDNFNSLVDPTVPVIMKVMGRDFAASGFDLKHLIRIIVNSKIYQRQAVTNDSNLYDYMFYSHQQVRELSPEMIERSILKAVGVEDDKGPARPVNPAQAAADNVPVTESSAAYKVRLHAMIANAFDGEDVLKDVDDRGGSLTRALMFLNGDILPKGPRTTIDEILGKPSSTLNRVEKIFATVLGRYPSRDEMKKLMATVSEWTDGKRAERDIYEDLFISLMCTPEFVNRN